MSQKAISLRARFEKTLTKYGTTVARVRPAYQDAQGIDIGAESASYRCLDQTTIAYFPMTSQAGGLDNRAQSDNHHVLYFSGLADLVEEDQLTFNGWVWKVTLMDPFVMDDVWVLRLIKVIRDRRDPLYTVGSFAG